MKFSKPDNIRCDLFEYNSIAVYICKRLWTEGAMPYYVLSLSNINGYDFLFANVVKALRKQEIISEKVDFYRENNYPSYLYSISLENAWKVHIL